MVTGEGAYRFLSGGSAVLHRERLDRGGVRRSLEAERRIPLEGVLKIEDQKELFLKGMYIKETNGVGYPISKKLNDPDSEINKIIF